MARLNFGSCKYAGRYSCKLLETNFISVLGIQMASIPVRISMDCPIFPAASNLQHLLSIESLATVISCRPYDSIPAFEASIPAFEASCRLMQFSNRWQVWFKAPSWGCVLYFSYPVHGVQSTALLRCPAKIINYCLELVFRWLDCVNFSFLQSLS